MTHPRAYCITVCPGVLGGRPLADGRTRRQAAPEPTLGVYRRFLIGKNFPIRKRRGKGHVGSRRGFRGNAGSYVGCWVSFPSLHGTASTTGSCLTGKFTELAMKHF